MRVLKNKYRIRSFPKEVTEPCQHYLQEIFSLFNLITFLCVLCKHTDEARKGAINALLLTADEEEERQLKEELKNLSNGKTTIGTLKKHLPKILEMIFCRAIDYFHNYLAEIVYQIYLKVPDSLKSNEKINIEEVLSYSNFEELISGIAEDKVNQLLYHSVKALSDYFISKFGLNLFRTDRDLQYAIELIETRNLLVHNKGLVNKTFLRRVKKTNLQLGDKIVFKSSEFIDKIDFFTKIIIELDIDIKKKFSISTVLLDDKIQYSS